MRASWFLCVCLLAGCSYKPYSEDPVALYVPYVTGDSRGQFTDRLIRTLSTAGHFMITSKDLAELTLYASIISNEQHPIGYMRHRQDTTGRVKNNLIATESRRSLSVEITLKRGEEVVFGPAQIKASTEYDYVDSDSLYDLTFINAQGQREKVIKFSLGQLDSIEGAQDDALTPLYDALAKKISDGLIMVKPEGV